MSDRNGISQTKDWKSHREYGRVYAKAHSLIHYSSKKTEISIPRFNNNVHTNFSNFHRAIGGYELYLGQGSSNPLVGG